MHESQVHERKGANNITFAGLRLGAIALYGVCLVSCVVSPQRPAAQYRVAPQGPHEQAVAQAFEALVRAYGRQDWGDVMALIADDAQIEPAVPNAPGPSGVDSPRVLKKHEFGQAIKPIIASMRGYQVENVELMTVSPAQVQVSGTVTLLMEGRPSRHDRDRFWVFEKRGERWLVVRARDLLRRGCLARHWLRSPIDHTGSLAPQPTIGTSDVCLKVDLLRIRSSSFPTRVKDVVRALSLMGTEGRRRISELVRGRSTMLMSNLIRRRSVSIFRVPSGCCDRCT